MKTRFNNAEYYDFIYGEDIVITSLEGYPYSEDINSDFNENDSN